MESLDQAFSVAESPWQQAGLFRMQDKWWNYSDWSQESISSYHPLTALIRTQNSSCPFCAKMR